MKTEELEWITASRGTNEELVKNRQFSRNTPMVRTPQFPGVNPGMSIEAVREVIRNQKRVKGFKFELSVGADNSFDLELSGTARLLLGFVFLPPPDFVEADVPLSVTMTINEEIVIQQVNPIFFSSSLMDDEYYFIPRPLSGQDNITVQFNAPASFTLFLAVYYI